MNRLHLVQGPTPLVRLHALDAMLGVSLSVKRDDCTGGAESGNKLRKLEWLLADALAQRASVVVTCGAVQSNHARATAVVAASLGMKSVLLLRVPPGSPLPTDPGSPAPREALPLTGNVLLDRLVGAELRFVSPADYARRGPLMEEVARHLAQRGERPYVIPEGGSNGLGALGYVEAMREVRGQLALGLGGGPAPFDELVLACGSGGTAAGAQLGAGRHEVARRVRAVVVCDDRAYFEGVIARIADEARSHDAELGAGAELVVDDAAKGPRYGVMSADQRAFLVEVARTSGLLLDPVYTGKALFGLREAVRRGDLAKGARVLFLHTGGLPGLLAQGEDLAEAL